MAPPHLRLFVACELPEVLRSALAGLQAELEERAGVQLRWVRAEGIHLTLKFLGEVEESRLDQIESALFGSIEPFEIRVRLAKLGAPAAAGWRAPQARDARRRAKPRAMFPARPSGARPPPVPAARRAAGRRYLPTCAWP